jgi:uncharacterized protein
MSRVAVQMYGGQMTNLEIAKHYLGKIASLDFDGALAFAAEDAWFQGPDGSILNKEEMGRALHMLRDRFAGPLEMTILGSTCEDGRIAIEATGSAPIVNGKVYTNRYHYAIEVEEGLIVAFREYCCTKAPDVIFA